MRFKGDPNGGLLGFVNGGCGCLMMLVTLIYIPVGLLLVTGVLKAVPRWIQAEDLPGIQLPFWGYLVTGLICAVGLVGSYGINRRRWWGILFIFLATFAFIGLDVSLGFRWQDRLYYLIWPALISVLLWAPWKKGTASPRASPELVIEGDPEVDYRFPLVLEEQPRRPLKTGTITPIRAEDLPPYIPPAGTAAARAQIERMKASGDILGLLHARANSLGWEDGDAAARALGSFDPPQIVPALIAALDDEQDAVRAEAANRLGSSRDARAFRPLLAALSDPAGNVRGGSASHLGGFGDLRAVQPLIGCLDDPDPYVRMAAAKSLGELGDVSAVEPLIRRLEDGDQAAAVAAAMALGELGDRRARQPLVDLLKRLWESLRSDTPLYGAAMQALDRLDAGRV